MGGISNMVGRLAAIVVEDSRWIGGTLNKEIVVSRSDKAAAVGSSSRPTTRDS